MKKLLSRFKSVIAALSVIFTTIIPSSVLAYDGAVLHTADGEAGIDEVLNLAVDILSVGVGIFAVIGIVIVGIQYMTAGGNEEQTRKAKRRIFEIVIGVAVYVLMYALLKWLGIERK